MPSYRKTKSMIKREISKQQDLKTAFREVVSYGITNTILVTVLPFPARGGAVNERLGDDIYLKSFEIRMRVSAPENDDCVRLILVQMKTPVDNAGLSALPDLVMMQGNGTAFSIIDPFNSQETMTYHILDDFVCNLNEDVAPRSFYYHRVFTAKDFNPHIHIIGDDAWTGNWDTPKNMIVLFQVSNSGILPNPTAYLNWKLNFVDG